MESSAKTIERNIDREVVNQFRDGLDGALLLQGEEGYEQARLVWNGMIDKYPMGVVACESVADVQAAVIFARNQNLPLAVRGGGHNVAGLATCDGGLVLDMTPMHEVVVDPEAKTVAVEGGAQWAHADLATAEHGLIVPGGVVSDTGVGGLTLSGGIGHFRRKFGMTCDSLIGAEMVAANGEIVTCDLNHNSDLLWALRGGGGNFGIVTRFVFRAHEAGPDVRIAAIFYPGEQGKRVLQWLREAGSDLPEEISIVSFYGVVPEGEPFPTEIHGRPFYALLALHDDTGEVGEQALQPLREQGEPMFEIFDVVPYVEAQQFFDEDYPRHELRYYWKSKFMKAMPDEALDVMWEQAQKQPSPRSTLDIWQLGGAMRRQDNVGSAAGSRAAEFLFNVEANWEQAADDDANIAWARETLDKLKPWLEEQAYLNFPGFIEEGAQQARDAFGDDYTRLVDLKRRYDPDNLFRFNTNIDPEG
ncbi:FAD-binding oxidoreductase [bacterium]|nr:FAD-binding oxidoreductase [bacterium]